MRPQNGSLRHTQYQIPVTWTNVSKFYTLHSVLSFSNQCHTCKSRAFRVKVNLNRLERQLCCFQYAVRDPEKIALKCAVNWELTLFSNTLLIAQAPWRGWGWGGFSPPHFFGWLNYYFNFLAKSYTKKFIALFFVKRADLRENIAFSWLLHFDPI